MRLGCCAQIAVSSTGKVLVIADPLYTTGPQSCGIFGASPGYLTNGQVHHTLPQTQPLSCMSACGVPPLMPVCIASGQVQHSCSSTGNRLGPHDVQPSHGPHKLLGSELTAILCKLCARAQSHILTHSRPCPVRDHTVVPALQVYIYTLDTDTNQYNLTQTLSGNSTSVTGFGTDIGEDSHGLIPRPALAH